MKVSPTVRASLELLGVSSETSAADLKKAYYRLALLYHPDRNPGEGAEHEFRKVTEAYELLSDPVRVADLNRRHLKEKLHRRVIEGIEITFGSFFGYRLFDFGAAFPKATYFIEGRVDENAKSFEKAETWLPLEENSSILDNAAYDAIEVVYAGKLSGADEEQLKGEVEGKKLARLPWVILNNQGILRFLDGDLRGAKKCYRELCERIPNNIVFMYRLALCEILEGFAKPRRTFLGGTKPDRLKIERGVEILRHCLKLGAERSVGRQKCLVIRKVLADVLEKTGRAREARSVWKGILYDDPFCAEAVLKVDGREAATKIMRKKARAPERLAPGNQTARLGPSVK